MPFRVNILVDWGRAFVDPNGSFYCGTTEAQKENAARILKVGGDLIIYTSDIHPRTSLEFKINGGLYPAHNLVLKDQSNTEELGIQSGQTTSPQLTEQLYQLVKDKKSGLIVPRHVFFQDYDGGQTAKPCFSFRDVEETFGVPALKPQEFLEGKLEYIVNAKHLFNGAALQATDWLGHVDKVPDLEMNAFSLLKQKYGQGRNLEFNVDGVVMGICVYQTAGGIKQMFPNAKVNVIADASTHLIYAPLGIPDAEIGNLVASRMCQQIGVNYLTTKEYLGEKK
jgi:nicotinamidase-related amidase